MSLLLGLEARMDPLLVCLIVIPDSDILTKYGGFERMSGAKIELKMLMLKNTSLGKNVLFPFTVRCVA